jgi:hypothetical protein
MRYIVLVLALVGCGVEVDAIETRGDVLIVVKPTAVEVSCVLNGKACECEMSECSEAAINAAADFCNRLWDPIVVE